MSVCGWSDSDGSGRGRLLGRQTGTGARPRRLSVQLPAVTVANGRRRSFSGRVDAAAAVSLEDCRWPRPAHQPHPGRLRHAEGGGRRGARMRGVRRRDRAPGETADVADCVRR